MKRILWAHLDKRCREMTYETYYYHVGRRSRSRAVCVYGAEYERTTKSDNGGVGWLRELEPLLGNRIRHRD
jgi:hypothetical protein